VAREFEGKTVLISGSARGQGAAHARRFAEEGATVVVSDVRDELGESVVEEIKLKGGRAVYRHLDVRSTQEWVGLVEQIEQEFGQLNILVNNAGIVDCSPILECSDEVWDNVIATNQGGVFRGTRAAVPALRRAGGGAIVNISSIMGLSGSWGYAAYIASKFAVIGLTKSTALTYAADHIRVNAVAPSSVDTPMLDAEKVIMAENPYFDFDEWIASQPIPTIAQPEEVSELVLYLASDRARYCTGAVYPIDGGILAGAG
jgi:NAD(P)-dependent dehydrogenase (short-subunit alcohol dehydrogenase family)